MNSQGPQGRHSGRAADRDGQDSQLIESQFKLGQLIGMFDALPSSLDSLVGEVFSERVKFGGDPLVACQFDYFCVIDDRPVTELQHTKVCTALLNKLAAIVAWCNDNSVSLSAVIDQELSQGDLLQSQTGEEWRRERSPIFLLKMIRDLDSGTNPQNVLLDLQTYWVHAEVKVALRRLLQRITKALVSSYVNDDEGKSSSKGFPEGIWHRELGIRYYRIGDRGFVYRAPKKPPMKEWVELSEKQTEMFEKLLHAPNYQCGDEQLNGPHGKADERGRNRKLRDALNNRLYELGLEILDSRLKKI